MPGSWAENHQINQRKSLENNKPPEWQPHPREAAFGHSDLPSWMTLDNFLDLYEMHTEKAPTRGVTVRLEREKALSPELGT